MWVITMYSVAKCDMTKADKISIKMISKGFKKKKKKTSVIKHCPGEIARL